MVGGKWVAWNELSLHPNLKAVSPWVLLVTGTHETFGVDGEWLPKQTVSGSPHVDVSGLDLGAIIKVSGASHSNKKNVYYRVLAVTESSLHVERVAEADVLDELAGTGERDALAGLREEVVALVLGCADGEALREARARLEAEAEAAPETEGS